MPTATKKSIPYGQHTLTLETGEIARQAGGAVLVSLGDSVVLVTAVAAKRAKPPGKAARTVRKGGKTASKASKRPARTAAVFSTVVLKDRNNPIQVTYLMRRHDNDWKIYDITLDAISVVIEEPKS